MPLDMLEINEFNVSVYVIVATAMIVLGTKFSRPGAMRVVSFATLFSLFFSMGLLVGHGAMPFPGLWILGSCLFTNLCTKMYGDMNSTLLLTLAPMFVQWLIILAVSFAVHYAYVRTAFDRSVSDDTKMNKHQRIVAIAFIVAGGILVVISAILFGTLYFDGKSIPIYYVMSYRNVAAVLAIGAGYSLLRDFAWAHWLCLPFSIFMLRSFPVGTVLGAYYLWYYFAIKRPAQTPLVE